MDVLLLAAGFGTRLRPTTNYIPKCMVEIGGRPLLEHWLLQILKNDIKNNRKIRKIYINTHHLSDEVKKFVENHEYNNHIVLIHEEILLGTGGTLLNLCKKINLDELLVAHADNFTIFDIDEFIEIHKNRPSNTIMTMMTFKTNEPENCGIVVLDENKVLIEFHEKNKINYGKLANGAVYIFSKDSLNEIIYINKSNKILDISLDIIPKMINRIYTHENTIYHRDIGNNLSLNQARHDFQIVKKYLKY